MGRAPPRDFYRTLLVLLIFPEQLFHELAKRQSSLDSCLSKELYALWKHVYSRRDPLPLGYLSHRRHLTPIVSWSKASASALTPPLASIIPVSVSLDA